MSKANAISTLTEAREASGGRLFAKGNTVPTSGTQGYAKGCIFFHLDGTSASDLWYMNYGTNASCSFTAIGSTTAGTINVYAAEDIAAGEIVAIEGWNAVNSMPTVYLADADRAAGRYEDLYFAGSAISSGDTGVVSKRGTLSSIDTSDASAAGQAVYLSETAGGWTLTRPAAGLAIQIGIVTEDHASTGRITFDLVGTREMDIGGLANALGEAPAVDDLLAISDTSDTTEVTTKQITVQELFNAVGDLTAISAAPAIDDLMLATDESASGDPAKKITVLELMGALHNVTALSAAPAVDDLMLITDESTANDPARAITVQELHNATANFTPAAIANGDSIAFLDATDSAMKLEAIADIATLFAGVGLSATNSVLAVDLNEVTAAAVDVTADSIVIIDADASNATKKESIDDLVTALAGAGIANASSLFVADLNGVGAAAVDVTADSIAIIDADASNATKKESIDDFVTALAGDGIINTASQIVLSLNELTPAVVDVTADSIAIVDANDSNASRKESIDDLVTALAGAGLTNTASQFAVSGVSRAMMTEEALAAYPIKLAELANADDGLELDGAASNFEIAVGDWGTGTRSIKGNPASGASITDTLMFEFRLPPEYVEAGDVKIIVKALETVGAATVATTLSSEVYEDDEDGTITSVSGSWDATDITDSPTTFTNTLTATDLDPGDLLRVLLRIVTNDTGGAVGTIAQINHIEMQLDVKG